MAWISAIHRCCWPVCIFGWCWCLIAPAAGVIPEVNIIPTPKSLKPGDGAMPLQEAAILLGAAPAEAELTAATEINKAIIQSGAAAVPVKKASELADSERRRPAIIPGRPATHKLLAQRLQQSGLVVPAQPGGYLIATVPANNDDGEAYLLAGHDAAGVLHAAASFKFLLRRNEQNRLTARRAEIADWPDCAVRPAVLGSPLFENRNPARKLSASAHAMLDWCFDHKLNFADITSYRISQENFTVPADDIAGELRKFNAYAAARGIETCYHTFFTAVGYIPDDRGKPEFEGCLESGNLYWCWSRDALIQKQVDRAAAFLAHADFRNVIFHFRDGSPTEYWRDRCRQCRARFGDDRAAATANYIHLAYQAVRAKKPDIRLIFVVEPYYGNLNIPANQPYRDFFAKLTDMIPEDVYLVNADWTRESQESWKEVVRQPIMHWRNLTMDNFRTGRMFTTEPALAVQSGRFNNSRDIPYLSAAHFHNHRQPSMTMLTAAEFFWNVDAPGAVMLREDAGQPAERRLEDLFARQRAGYGAEWLWHRSTTEPAPVADELLPRMCAVLHGTEAAAMMAEIYRMGIADRILLMTGRLYSSAEYYNILRNPDVIRGQWQNAEKAVTMLDTFQAAGKSFKPGIQGSNELEAFRARLRQAAAAGAAHYHILDAELASKAREPERAAAALRAAAAVLEQQAGNNAFAALRKAYESAEMRHMIMQMAADKPGDVIQVGLYNPMETGGNVMGFMPIYLTLMQEREIRVEMIPALEALDRFDCIIIPDCKRFGEHDQGTMLDIEKEIYKAEKAVRDYVMREGRGALFYHDSVGYGRFPMGRGIFPELSTAAKKSNSLVMTIKAAHPVTAGYDVGATKEHMYFDHIAMQHGEWGQVLVVDEQDAAVVIAGDAGAGRVVLNGTYHAGCDGREPDVLPAGIERDLLVNAVRWLARKHPMENP